MLLHTGVRLKKTRICQIGQIGHVQQFIFSSFHIYLPIDDVSLIGMSVLKCPYPQLPKTDFRINYCFLFHNLISVCFVDFDQKDNF